MKGKGTHASKAVASKRVDDFKLIRGIGPAVEGRLHKKGILTFAQLTALSPKQLSGTLGNLAGLTAERIAKQDWNGQARRLAHVAAPTPAHGEELQSDDAERFGRQRYATYTVELLIDEADDVRRTRIWHVQSSAEDSWAGWEEARLANFVVEHAGLKAQSPKYAQRGTSPLPSNASSLSPAERKATSIPVFGISSPALLDKQVSSTRTLETSAPELAKIEAAAEPDSKVSSPASARVIRMARLRELVTVPEDSETPQLIVAKEQPFSIRLTLDLTEVVIPGKTAVEYQVTVYAKIIGGRLRQIVGESRGIVAPQGILTLNIEGTPLLQGVYRLEAVAALALPSAEAGKGSGVTSLLEGTLLQVY